MFLHHAANAAVAQRIVARALAGHAVERLVRVRHLTVRADELSTTEEKIIVGVENDRAFALRGELQALEREVRMHIVGMHHVRRDLGQERAQLAQHKRVGGREIVAEAFRIAGKHPVHRQAVFLAQPLAGAVRRGRDHGDAVSHAGLPVRQPPCDHVRATGALRRKCIGKNENFHKWAGK